MAEQTFKSPGFFEREIDLSQSKSSVTGVPAGIAGTAQMGPAFVPVTVGSFIDFENRFGTLDPDKFGPYAVNEFLKHRTALTYVRVLGAGANTVSADFSNTLAAGVVKGAGFALEGTNSTTGPAYGRGRKQGCVQFLTARHYVSGSESVGYPILSDNDSYSLSADSTANIIRGMLFTPSGTRFEILPYASSSYTANVNTSATILTNNDGAKPSSSGLFKLILSSTAGSNFAADEGYAGVKIYTASLDPAHSAYISNILNTDPEQFQTQQHLLYAHFPIEDEIAQVDRGSASRTWATVTGSLLLTSGSALGSSTSGLGTSVSFNSLFGRFDTRYTTPSTTFFISQPFGTTEYKLFKVESISDGGFANTKFKISIRDIRKAISPGDDPYGTFTLEVREFDDTDTATSVLERYTACTLNPTSDDYIAKRIGDYKAFYNFDAERDSERKVVVSGKYPNLSSRIRVVTSDLLDNGEIPADALPFGFEGTPVIKTNDNLTDTGNSLYGSLTPGALNGTNSRMAALLPAGAFRFSETPTRHIVSLTGSILPPLPFRFKCTRGAVEKSPTFTGQSGELERVDSRFYWGVKFTRLFASGTTTPDAIYRSNECSSPNPLIENYAKFMGIRKLDALVTGSDAGKFNNNKFTLARVSLPNGLGGFTNNLDRSIPTVITGSVSEHMLDTAYIRNGRVDPTQYTISDGSTTRLTFASLASLTSSVYFNKFVDYAKFTNMLNGGFDGLNILDSNMAAMNDKASSSDTGGYASGATLDIGLVNSANTFGEGDKNCTVQSYRTAARILTNEVVSRANIIAIPGIRDSNLTDYVMSLLKDYGKAFYVIDVPTYDADQNRLFATSVARPNVDQTSIIFAGRSIDNNYSAAYFPDVTITDEVNNRPVKVPSSIAVIGALAFNDSISYPWFAPAGFNRGSLGFVTNISVRLNQENRDTLYENRINPIASFPSAGYVIFGQKTLQILKSSLDRVNVRRMLLEVRRIVSDIAKKIVFEQNTPTTRARFIAEVTPLLSNVQSQQGIDQFKVIMDSSNNTEEDIINNILNGRIVLVPTRAVEFIAIDFIITNAGVDFV